MANILIVYATTEGHTRKIAQHVGGFIRAMGHNAEVVDSQGIREDFPIEGYNTYLVMGSVHMGHHQKSLVHFVKNNEDIIGKSPSAMLSVSLMAALKDANHEDEIRKCIEQFSKETDWVPDKWLSVAGAMKPDSYDWFKRMVLTSVSKKMGSDVDPAIGQEFTDWNELDTFVSEFLKNNFVLDLTHT